MLTSDLGPLKPPFLMLRAMTSDHTGQHPLPVCPSLRESRWAGSGGAGARRIYDELLSGLLPSSPSWSSDEHELS